MSLKSDAECVFCAAQRADDEQSLILHRARHSFIILNLYPYNNGHMMIVPFRHVAALAEAGADERAELMELAVRCQTALEKVYHPEGFNLGMNLGRCAGAGITAHLHLHVVPRWSGDTSFLAACGDTRVIPEDLRQSYKKLKLYFRN